jgi:hypothetical protein
MRNIEKMVQKRNFLAERKFSESKKVFLKHDGMIIQFVGVFSN